MHQQEGVKVEPPRVCMLKGISKALIPVSFLGIVASTYVTVSSMAWGCSGRSNLELIQRLRASNIIKSEIVKNIMLRVDRGNYAPDRAYEDSPQYIGFDATISAPHMHAYALELLHEKAQPGAHVLDVGCGSGYLTACFGRMVEPNGQVVGVDYISGLVQLSTTNVAKKDQDLISSGVVKLKVASGWDAVYEEAPFDAIHVGAAAESLPRALISQLKVGGVMVIPVGPQGGNQWLYKVEKVKDSGPMEETFVATELMGVRYVPLVKAQHEHE